MRRLARPTALLASVLVALTAGPAFAQPTGGGGEGPEEQEDLTAPRIEVAADRPSPWQGWYAANVTLHLQAFDDQGRYDEGLNFVEYELTGATAGVGRIDNAAGTAITIENAGVTTVTIAAFDNSGNIGRREYAVGIDRTRPTVAFGGRLAGDRIFYQGEKVAADYTCADVGTEVASCVGPVAAGADLSTVTVGSHVINVETTDRVGNTSRVPVTYEVFPRTFDVDAAPVILGSPVVGQTLTVTAPTFTPSPTSRGVRWYRNGQLVSSDAPYPVTPADVGATITAVSYANRAGWPEGTSTSAPVTGRAAPAPQLEVVGTATLQGTPRVGSLLTARPPTVREPVENLAAGDPARLAYQWLRDGRAIPRATGRTYRLAAADVGRRVAVRVTGTATGYEPAVRTSTATARVAKAAPRVRAAARALGGGRARLSVRVTAPGTPVTGRVTVRRGGKVVLRRSLTAGALTAVLTRQPRGRVTFTVAYGGSGGIAARSVRVTTRLR